MKQYSIDEVFSLIGEENLNTQLFNKSLKSDANQIVVDGHNVYTKSLRYMTFYQKGCTCCVCGKTGTYFTLDSTKDSEGRAHFNLHADDGTLITKDHIVPKSKGGRDHISNMQTMCTDCNQAKGNTCASADSTKMYNIVAVKVDNPEKVRTFTDENTAIFELLHRSKVTHPVTCKDKLGGKLRKTIEVTRTFLACLNTDVPYHNYLWFTKDKYEEKYDVCA